MTISLRDALIAARQWIARDAEHHSYGFFSGGDPRDFSPDEESCTPDEIAAHKAACEAWERGERPDVMPPGRIEVVTMLASPDGNGGIIPERTCPALLCGGSFGVGVYTYRDDEAAALVKRLDAEIVALTDQG